MAATARADKPQVQSAGIVVRVGIDNGDIRGNDHRALQAAVDYAAKMGGGTVKIGPGQYQMRNALILRDNVAISGESGKTILSSCSSAKTPLAADGDCYERQISLQDPSGFQVGDGVAIFDDHYKSGFEVTTATLTAKVDERTFKISSPLYLDYLVSKKAVCCLTFPVVGGWNVKNVVIEGLTIDGNQAKAEYVDGCRAGGIYLFESENVTVRNCTVRNYKGDGISFQVSHHVTIEDCLCENNKGLGIHPGSGSQYPVVLGNHSLNNGDDGLYVCWRVKHGRFEENEIRGNGGVGVSIGHKDTDNLFRGNLITANAKAGVLFREESQPMGAHRNVFESNRILDNGVKEGGASIVIRGRHDDLVFRKNTIGCSKTAAGGVGIRCAKESKGLQADDNQFVNLQTPIERPQR
jgi:parallel beta-helix repeat protein